MGDSAKGPTLIPTISRTPGGGVRIRLRPREAAVLQELPAQLEAALRAEGDPAVNARLFPNAYTDPGEQDAERDYQDLTREDLLSDRLAGISSVRQSLQRGQASGRSWSLELDAEESQAWLILLNDVRLILGVRLEITEEMDRAHALSPSDPRAPAFALYDYLTWLQSALLDALAP